PASQQSAPEPQATPAPGIPKTGSVSERDSAAESKASSLRERDLAEAEQARVLAAKARQDAERAAAPSRAPRTFSLGQERQKEAEASLASQDAASAKLQFQKAQSAYRQAAQEAERAATAEENQRVASLQRQRSDADQARDRMADAKRSAEQAGANQYSPKLFASAQVKERDAGTAISRSDYGAAERLFRDAESNYQTAAQEARRESEAQRQVAMLTSSVEQARSRVLARREEAIKSEANRLAKEAFDAAQAKQGEADALVARQNY